MLRYFETWSMICQNNTFHMSECLNLNMLKPLECWNHEWNAKVLTNLHNGQVNNKDSYIEKC